MTRKDHKKITRGVAISAMAITHILTANVVAAIIVAATTLPGGTAPDWMESSWWNKGNRYSLIPHRTLTHWVFAWVTVLGYSVYIFNNSSTWSFSWGISAAIIGFTAGGLSHCLSDVFTPMGVPFLSFWYRTSWHCKWLPTITGTMLASATLFSALALTCLSFFWGALSY